MQARIIGLGISTPPHSIERDRSLEFAQTMLYQPGKEARALPALYRMTSVQSRGSVLLLADASVQDSIAQDFYADAECPNDRGPSTQCRTDRFAIEALPLAARACREAIVDAKMAPEAITHIVVVTCTGFYSPGLDVELIEDLGLNAETERIQVGFMGCHAAINGLRVARGLIAAEPAAKVLMVSVEICTVHYQYGWDPDRVVSNAIFADGSAAVVLSGVDADEDCPAITATGSCLVADSKDAMTWRIGNNGFAMTLSAEVPGLIEAKLKGYITKWLARNGLTIRDIGGWAAHPGGPRILRSVEESLELPQTALAASRAVLSEHGNMSSATMLFILRRFMDSGVDRPWLMLGFGPGLEIEVALLR